MESQHLFRAMVIIILAFILLLTPTIIVYAHGFIDQYNDPASYISFGCGVPKTGNLYQSFTPSGPTPLLSGISLRLRGGGRFPLEGYLTTIRIRSENPTGPVLAEASTFVSSKPYEIPVHFDFWPPLSNIKPGNVFVIEWVAPPEGGSILTWMGSTTNTYPEGSMFGCGQTPIPDRDLNFITYNTPANSHAGEEPGNP